MRPSRKVVTIEPVCQTHRDTIIGSLDVGKHDLIYLPGDFPDPSTHAFDPTYMTKLYD
jgi:hypothetical protein